MKYDSWEDMVDAQAIAFSTLCAQNERLTELADKADDGFNFMEEAEQDELFTLLDEVYNDPFFSRRCEKEREEMDEQEHPEMSEEEPNNWDELEKESYVDLFGPWWE
jgi:uncharacterized membrane protein